MLSAYSSSFSLNCFGKKFVRICKFLPVQSHKSQCGNRVAFISQSDRLELNALLLFLPLMSVIINVELYVFLLLSSRIVNFKHSIGKDRIIERERIGISWKPLTQ